jgi:aminobenzoyl-glutamate transport protein
MALNLAGALGGNADKIGLLPLLIGFIIVVTISDILVVAAIAKWAIFAPVFVPLMMKLGATPEPVLAAYRIGDPPMNALTPVNASFGLVVGFARKYNKNAGVGNVVAMMLP